jgi:peroxiredoxin
VTRPLAAIGLLVLVCAGGPAEPVEIGGPVPEFAGRTPDGQAFSLSGALRSHPAVAVVFLSTLCPYARSFGSHLEDLGKRYGSQGLLLIGVNSNARESPEEVGADARRRGYTFPIVKDADHSIADALGANVTPEAFVIDGSGRLRYQGRVKSRQGATELEDAVDAVIAGRRVKTPVAKAFGCAIQRE